MSDLGWFGAFAIIFVVMVGVTGWITWYSRRTMRAETRQLEDMIREMRDVIDKDDPPEQ